MYKIDLYLLPPHLPFPTLDISFSYVDLYMPKFCSCQMMGDEQFEHVSATDVDDAPSNNDVEHNNDHVKTAFVTVGTTEFDALIRRIRSPSILSQLRSRGYRRIVFQIGRGAFEPSTSTDADGAGGSGVEEGVEIQWFRLKPSIAEVIREISASLAI